MGNSAIGRPATRIRRLILPVLGTLVLLGGSGAGFFAFMRRAPEPAVSPAASARLAEGRAYIDSLGRGAAAARRPQDVALETAVALGYVERLRLGLGSPFRLAEFALQDPRLSVHARVRTAWALLDASRRGDAHVVDARALATVLPARAGGADHHLALIEHAMTEGDPRAGELAVRLAYELAAAERVVGRPALPVLAQATALIRDRELARIDVTRLLDAAAVEGRDPLALIPEWRAARRFASERPATEAQDQETERRALPRVAALLDSIGVLAAEAKRGDTTRLARVWLGRAPVLPSAAADRLAADAGYLPPQGPVAVAMRTHHALLAAALPDTRVARAWVAGLAERIAHDEALAAEHARTVWSGGHNGAIARVTLAAAAGMRAYAQERPWFPGMPGPTAVELKRDYGFEDVKFTSAVPAAWRPYFRRMLASAASDLLRVVPTARFDGLRVRVESVPTDAPLAVHDPAARLLRLPVATAAGVLAHELAHDLDWQAARRLYARRSGYSTDYAVRTGQDRVAESVQALTSARLIPPTEENDFRPPHDRRPAEVFARNFDWFVAMSLAREGRVNGYLTAVQDEVLTGYATVSAREADGRGAEALMRLLGDVVYVPSPVRDWFLEHWGPTRTLRSYALVRELMLTPPVRGGAATLGRADSAFDSRLVQTAFSGAALSRTDDVAGCDGRGAASSERPQVALARLAAHARARGTLLVAARRLPTDQRPPWAQSVLGIAPWAPELAEAATLQVRDILLQHLASRASLASPFAADPACAKTESTLAP